MWDVTAPVVTPNAVYVDYCCSNVLALQPRSGRLLWTTNVNGFSAGWNIMAVYQDRVYARDVDLPSVNGVVLDAASGQNVGRFRSAISPAFHDGVAFFVDQGILTAQDPVTGTVRWSFRGDAVNSAPLVAGGHVFVGSASATLYSLNELSGTNSWSEAIPGLSPSTDAPAFGEGVVITGFNIGRATLVVTTSRNVIAYGSAQ
jgi:outer membrane protein assembly factor BamB